MNKKIGKKIVGMEVQKVCWFLLHVITGLLLLVVGPADHGVAGGEIACHAIRYIFHNKNLDASQVPKSPRQGIENSHD